MYVPSKRVTVVQHASGADPSFPSILTVLCPTRVPGGRAAARRRRGGGGQGRADVRVRMLVWRRAVPISFSFPSPSCRSLSILVNGAAGNFLATAEDLKTKGFKVCS